MHNTRRQLLTLAAAAALSGPALAAAPKLPAAKSIRLFGATIRYYELGVAGTKPTLVLLHGLGSSAAGDWGQVMPALAKTHHVLALDQLGFGQSDKPFIQYGIQTWVDFLGEFLREKKVADGGFQLMGESLGGWIAAQYTLQALRGDAVGESFKLPRPSRLVLCDAAGYREAMAAHFEKPAEASRRGAGPSLAGEKSLLASIFRAPSFNTEASIRNGLGWSISKGDSHTIASVYSNPAILNESVDGQLDAIKIPTLVVWGQHDTLLPLHLGERFAREIPGARLVVVPDSGHAPMIETPSAFLAALGDFLSQP